jgi:succinate dehydrogenase iron-sulfur subunit
MKLTVRIKRFNPEKDTEAYWQEFPVEADSQRRVLDVLMDIKKYQDGSLGLRKSCAHGVCGSDAMRINDLERLACKTLVQDVASEDGATVTVEPLRHFPVQKDLLVDQTEFFRKFRSVKPFLIAKEPPEEKEYIQSPEEREAIDDATKCILCGACMSACPVMSENPLFLGPAAIVNASRFVNDTRDEGLKPRLSILDDPDGVWPCENHFECTRVCPRGIKITKLINQTKRQIKKYKEAGGEA